MGIEDLLRENNQLLKQILNKLNNRETAPTNNNRSINEFNNTLSNYHDLPDATCGIISEFKEPEISNIPQVKVISLGKSQFGLEKNVEYGEEEEEEEVVVKTPPKILKVINPKKVIKKVKKVKTVKTVKTGKTGKKQTGGKKPNAYQLFMKKQIPIYKKKNPKKSHREAFSAVAKLWKKQKN
jgi:hypothetical protein